MREINTIQKLCTYKVDNKCCGKDAFAGPYCQDHVKYGAEIFRSFIIIPLCKILIEEKMLQNQPNLNQPH